MHPLIHNTFLIPTGENNEEDDGNIDEEELEVSKITEDLRNKTAQITVWICHSFLSSYCLWKQHYIQSRGA